MKGLLLRSKRGYVPPQQEVDAAMAQLDLATGAESAVSAVPSTAAYFPTKKLPQPTPRGKWQQYQAMVYHGTTKARADAAIRDYQKWNRRENGRMLTD